MWINLNIFHLPYQSNEDKSEYFSFTKAMKINQNIFHLHYLINEDKSEYFSIT